jgi:hypothetical protein
MRASSSIASVPEEERFVTYSLGDMLPEGDKIILDRELRILTQVRVPDGIIIEQQRFTDNEYYLLIEILSSFPYYCPLEKMLSAHYGRSLERCRQDFIRARQDGSIDALMRPVRNVLSKVRLKIHPFALEISSILDTGYILMQDNPLRRNGL